MQGIDKQRFKIDKQNIPLCDGANSATWTPTTSFESLREKCILEMHLGGGDNEIFCVFFSWVDPQFWASALFFCFNGGPLSLFFWWENQSFFDKDQKFNIFGNSILENWYFQNKNSTMMFINLKKSHHNFRIRLKFPWFLCLFSFQLLLWLKIK